MKNHVKKTHHMKVRRQQYGSGGTVASSPSVTSSSLLVPLYRFPPSLSLPFPFLTFSFLSFFSQVFLSKNVKMDSFLTSLLSLSLLNNAKFWLPLQPSNHHTIYDNMLSLFPHYSHTIPLTRVLSILFDHLIFQLKFSLFSVPNLD